MRSLIVSANTTPKHLVMLKSIELAQASKFGKCDVLEGMSVSSLSNRVLAINNAAKVVKSNALSLSFIKEAKWRGFRDEIRRLLSGYDAVLVVGMIHLQSFNAHNCKAYDRTVKSCKDDDCYGLNFATSVNLSKFINFVDVADEMSLRVVQLIIDPQEANLDECCWQDVDRYHYYAYDDVGYLPRLGFTLKEMNNCEDKTTLFTFCGTAVTKDRRFIFGIADVVNDFVKDLNDGSSFFVAEKGKVSSYVRQDDYFSMLEKSKMSMVVQAYDNNAFSMSRFVECVSCGCVPLVWHECNVDVLKKTFKGLHGFITKHLIVNESNMKNKLKMDVDGVCDELVFLLQKEFDEDMVQAAWNEVVNV